MNTQTKEKQKKELHDSLPFEWTKEELLKLNFKIYPESLGFSFKEREKENKKTHPATFIKN